MNRSGSCGPDDITLSTRPQAAKDWCLREAPINWHHSNGATPRDPRGPWGIPGDLREPHGTLRDPSVPSPRMVPGSPGPHPVDVVLRLEGFGTNRQTEKHTYKETDGHMDKKTDRQTQTYSPLFLSLSLTLSLSLSLTHTHTTTTTTTITTITTTP